VERPIFASLQDYGRRFTDVAIWREAVEAVCAHHNLAPDAPIRSGLPGSHPVFLVGDRWVVKFLSDWFGGEWSWRIEHEIFALLDQIPEAPAARLVAAGDLFADNGGWRWPYLISTQLSGTSLGEVYDQIDEADREQIAQQLGYWLRQLHYARLRPDGALRPDWTPFCDWLHAQRIVCVENHRRWRSLPDHLIDQLDEYLPDIDALVDRAAPPLLLHCDLNADHLLGEIQEGRWTSSGIIDFGDARIGDFHYELVALHLGLFHGDTSLLNAFLRAYGSDAGQHPDFVLRAMACTLLHEFNVLEPIREIIPDLDRIETLTELAHRLWHQEEGLAAGEIPIR
jgi:hygromycin-B 7''-O-kinase